MLIKLAIRFALWRAAAHTRRSAWWNDVAEAWLTGATIEEIQKRRWESGDAEG